MSNGASAKKILRDALNKLIDLILHRKDVNSIEEVVLFVIGLDKIHNAS
jgi:hypothetical protein